MIVSKLSSSSDLIRKDDGVPDPDDHDDVPELTDDFFAEADLHKNGVLVRRGRPRSEAPKISVTIRLSPGVVGRFRATGRGWQGRMEAVLAEWLDRHPDIG